MTEKKQPKNMTEELTGCGVLHRNGSEQGEIAAVHGDYVVINLFSWADGLRCGQVSVVHLSQLSRFWEIFDSQEAFTAATTRAMRSRPKRGKAAKKDDAGPAVVDADTVAPTATQGAFDDLD
jgi:hypothetical protein